MHNIKQKAEIIEYVQDCNYLGKKNYESLDNERAIKRRKVMEWSAFVKQKSVMQSNLSPLVKRKFMMSALHQF